MSELTPKQWLSELALLVDSPAWPGLLPWFEQQLVQRVMRDADPIAKAIDAAHELGGARALLLAIDNAVTTGEQDGRRTETARQRVSQQQRAAQARGEGIGKRGGRAGSAGAQSEGTA